MAGLCNEKTEKYGPFLPLAQQVSLQSDRLPGAALRFVHHMTLLYSRPHNACVVPGGAARHITPGAALALRVWAFPHDVA